MRSPLRRPALAAPLSGVTAAMRTPAPLSPSRITPSTGRCSRRRSMTIWRVPSMAMPPVSPESSATRHPARCRSSRAAASSFCLAASGAACASAPKASASASAQASGVVMAGRRFMGTLRLFDGMMGVEWGGSVDADQRGVVGRAVRGEPARGGFDPGELLQQVHALSPQILLAGGGQVGLRQRGIDRRDAGVELATEQFKAGIADAVVAREGDEGFELRGLRLQLLQRVASL